MDFAFAPSHTNDLDAIIVAQHKKEEAEKERERAAKEAKEAKKPSTFGNQGFGSTLTVPSNMASGDGDSVGLEQIIDDMGKKLDSAQRKFNP